MNANNAINANNAMNANNANNAINATNANNAMMIIHLITFRIFYPKWLRSNTRFICSELIANAFYKEADFKFSKYTEYGYVTPGDIAKTAKEKDNVSVDI